MEELAFSSMLRTDRQWQQFTYLLLNTERDSNEYVNNCSSYVVQMYKGSDRCRKGL